MSAGWTIAAALYALGLVMAFTVMEYLRNPGDTRRGLDSKEIVSILLWPVVAVAIAVMALFDAGPDRGGP